MHELTIEWQEAGHLRRQIIRDRQLSKNPGTVRLGRDPMRCDIVLTHPTVSGLHVEIFFNQQQNRFYLRNLRDTNPPWVDGNRLTKAEIALSQGSSFFLGETEIKITAVNVEVSSVPPTILISSPPTSSKPQTSLANNQPQLASIANPDISAKSATPVVAGNQVYGLRCPNAKCDRISPYERLDLGCPWCGTSLAAAESVLMNPN